MYAEVHTGIGILILTAAALLVTGFHAMRRLTIGGGKHR